MAAWLNAQNVAFWPKVSVLLAFHKDLSALMQSPGEQAGYQALIPFIGTPVRIVLRICPAVFTPSVLCKSLILRSWLSRDTAGLILVMTYSNLLRPKFSLSGHVVSGDNGYVDLLQRTTGR